MYQQTQTLSWTTTSHMISDASKILNGVRLTQSNEGYYIIRELQTVAISGLQWL